jgi:hypothetical protein
MKYFMNDGNAQYTQKSFFMNYSNENLEHHKIIPNEICLYLLLKSHYQDDISSPYSEKLDELVPDHSHLTLLKFCNISAMKIHI